MHDPDRGHWEAVKWALQYIKGTIDVGLIFEKDVMGKHECIRYVDSDYAGDLDKRRSTMGYVFTLSQTPASYRTILQSTVALSTMEAEYMAMTEAMKEAICLQRLLNDLWIDQDLLKINFDSMSAIYLTKNQCIMQGRNTSMSGSTLSGKFLMKVTSTYRTFTQERIPLICLPR